jgi:hypothetical protein
MYVSEQIKPPEKFLAGIMFQKYLESKNGQKKSTKKFWLEL